MLSHGKGAAFFPHLSQGVLGAHQQLGIDLTACANMWGEYWDSLICTVSKQSKRVPNPRLLSHCTEDFLELFSKLDALVMVDNCFKLCCAQ